MAYLGKTSTHGWFLHIYVSLQEGTKGHMIKLIRCTVYLSNEHADNPIVDNPMINMWLCVALGFKR